ncbi:hypothetical protein O181_077754 [Austropuccinia psidii MF-1]|uniref:Uncharacterized protein n=1 Tax=Austropuccinia psidii MF-1 TaxID=1389203 RepID=A0A9Q3FFJ5_9BASI|nr:hypothetical protein [Austropuccinia psidii MF-1]
MSLRSAAFHWWISVLLFCSCFSSFIHTALPNSPKLVQRSTKSSSFKPDDWRNPKNDELAKKPIQCGNLYNASYFSPEPDTVLCINYGNWWYKCQLSTCYVGGENDAVTQANGERCSDPPELFMFQFFTTHCFNNNNENNLNKHAIGVEKALSFGKCRGVNMTSDKTGQFRRIFPTVFKALNLKGKLGTLLSCRSQENSKTGLYVLGALKTTIIMCGHSAKFVSTASRIRTAHCIVIDGRKNAEIVGVEHH